MSEVKLRVESFVADSSDVEIVNSIMMHIGEKDQLRQKLEATEEERNTYKEDLFQLRQKAENWSTKLGFVTAAINSRKVAVSEKEREFPHLLIERLHTESALYKQKFERSEGVIREAQEQEPYAYAITGHNIDMAARSVDIDELKRREPNWNVSPLYAHPPIPADHSEGWRPIETLPENGDFLLFFPKSDDKDFQIHSARVHPNVTVVGGRFLFDFSVKPTHWMPLPNQPKSEVKPS